MSEQLPSIYAPKQALTPKLRILVAALILVAFGVRMYRITAPPIDFHPSRQLMCGAIAHGMYITSLPDAPEWQKAVAEANWKTEFQLEPRITETVATWCYRLAGSEQLWMPKALAALYWMIGGLLLFLIARNLSTDSTAIGSLFCYLFFPFGILATRSFQPDPMVVACFLAGLHAFLLCIERQTPLRVAAPAILWSLCIFMKPILLPSIGLICLFLFTWRHGWANAFKSPVPYIVGVCFILPILYYAGGILGEANADSKLREQASQTVLPALLLTKKYWFGLINMTGRMVGLIPLAIAIWAAWCLPKEPFHRILMRAWWIGYLCFCFIFTWHAHTHDYYQLQLIPLVAVSYAFLLQRLVEQKVKLLLTSKLPLALVIIIPLALQTMVLLPKIKTIGKEDGPSIPRFAIDYVGGLVGFHKKMFQWVLPAFHKRYEKRIEIAKHIGESIGHPLTVIYLGEDGGTDLTYYAEIAGHRWPAASLMWLWTLEEDPRTVTERVFNDFREAGAEWFVITDFGDLERQPELQAVLNQYQVFMKSDEDRYVVYKLTEAAAPTKQATDQPAPAE